MSKVSVIIPTLWRAKEFTDHLVSVLIEDDCVGEVIIIDNEPTDFFYKFDKVITFWSIGNMYVNPSWNLGIEESSYDKFIILNDDIIIPYNFVSQLEKWLTKNRGIIGIDAPSVIKVEGCSSETMTFLDREIALKSIVMRDWGFGIVIAGHKESYHKIPENIRIWYGDDYLVQMNNEIGKVNYVIDDIPIFTKMSATSDLEEFNEIKDVDRLMYERFVKWHQSQ
jgi:glycosyltransferase involved in cell wall biosynthesis